MQGMTRRQYDLLTFLTERGGQGIPPSFDEMRAALGLRSKSGIFRLINALEERGYIRRLQNRARAIEVLAHPKRVIEMRPSAWDLLKREADKRGEEVNAFAGQVMAVGLHMMAVSDHQRGGVPNSEG
jgi:repressor LexA